MEVTVTLNTNKEYGDDLKRRLDREGVSQNVLAAELGKSPTQVSRWFTKNAKRRVIPTLEMVKEIEAAFKLILDRRKRRERRAEAKTSAEGSSMHE